MPPDLNALNLCGMANYRRGNFARAMELLRHAQHMLPGHEAIGENLRLARSALANQSRTGNANR